MKRLASRRAFLGTTAVAGGAAILGAGAFIRNGGVYLPPGAGDLQGVTEILTYASSQLLEGQVLAQEYTSSEITKTLQNIDIAPATTAYQQHVSANFANWRLQVSGLVQHQLSLGLKDLRVFQMTKQITLLTCYGGWSQVQPFSGVQLSRVLNVAGLRERSRFVVFEAMDGWFDSIDLKEALHPQTLLTYGGLNGEPLTPGFGAPLRLRVPRHMGQKSIKWISAIKVVDDLDAYRDGMGSWGASVGDSWFSGPS